MLAVEIFIAYSHNDLRHKDELKKFLSPLLNNGSARIWDDYDIEAGQNWEAEIKKRLYGADIILLLVSPDSLASEYFYGNEVKVSLERHDKGEAKVIPIILRPCAWKLTERLGTLEVLPEKGRPVTKYELQDEAFTHIAHELDDVIREISNHRHQASERENQYRGFEAVAHTADHLFHKGEWATARTSYLEAIQLHQPGFSPSLDTMRQRIAECDKQEGQMLVRHAFEQRLADFSEKMRQAEQLYKNENWREARLVYGELIKSHETGFPSEPSEFRRRQLECDQGIQEQDRIAKEERERRESYQKQLSDAHRLMRKRAYYEALQAARTALAISPDDAEALRMIGEAEAGIVRLPEELRAARKRMIILAGVIAAACVIVVMAFLFWEKQQEARRLRVALEQEKTAFKQASSENTIPTWKQFNAEYPGGLYEAQAKDSISSIEQQKRGYIKVAKDFIEQNWHEDAIEPLNKAYALDSSDVEVISLLEQAKGGPK
ncbi:MAG: toll/interleukin-1 receptor domain-containing protein [Saprospiraceae bacterium]